MLFPRRKARHIFNQAWRNAHPKKKSFSPSTAKTTYSVVLQYPVPPEQSELLARVLSKDKLIPYADAMEALETIPAVFRTRVTEDRAYQFKQSALKADIALTVVKN